LFLRCVVCFFRIVLGGAKKWGVTKSPKRGGGGWYNICLYRLHKKNIINTKMMIYNKE